MKKIMGIIASLIFSSASMGQEQIDFKVDIPNSWKLVSYSAKERLWAYESNNGNHRLTVSILYFSKEPTHAQQNQFLNEFLKTRQEQSSKLISNSKFTEIEVNEYSSAWVAKFNEISPDGRFATNKAISSRIGIANFYFESFSSNAIHEELSNKILSTTGFSS